MDQNFPEIFNVPTVGVLWQVKKVSHLDEAKVAIDLESMKVGNMSPDARGFPHFHG